MLIDEIIPPESTWASAPRQVSIALTNACDLACSYCFAPKSRATLPFDLVVSWLHELESNGTIGVGFGGGEPTLYPQFAELCAEATRSTNLAITFTTHGHHLSDSVLASLKGNVHFIRVSMDGVEETYERLRGRSFRSLGERLRAISAFGPFGINYVINADTLCDLDAAAIIAETVGASELLLLPERPVNGSGGVDESTLCALRQWVHGYSGSMRLAITESNSDGMPICNPFSNDIGLRGFAHIDANGVLKRTSYDHEGIAIRDYDVMAALKELNYTSQTLL